MHGGHCNPPVGDQRTIDPAGQLCLPFPWPFAAERLRKGAQRPSAVAQPKLDEPTFTKLGSPRTPDPVWLFPKTELGTLRVTVTCLGATSGHRDRWPTCWQGATAPLGQVLGSRVQRSSRWAGGLHGPGTPPGSRLMKNAALAECSLTRDRCTCSPVSPASLTLCQPLTPKGIERGHHPCWVTAAGLCL